MFIYLQLDLNWRHPQKIKERLGLLGLVKYRHRPFYYRPFRMLLTSPAQEPDSDWLQWCRGDIRSVAKNWKKRTGGVEGIEQRYPVTQTELGLLVKERNKFLRTSQREQERWKETVRSLQALGLTECSLVIREKAFPLEDIWAV